MPGFLHLGRLRQGQSPQVGVFCWAVVGAGAGERAPIALLGDWLAYSQDVRPACVEAPSLTRYGPTPGPSCLNSGCPLQRPLKAGQAGEVWRGRGDTHRRMDHTGLLRWSLASQREENTTVAQLGPAHAYVSPRMCCAALLRFALSWGGDTTIQPSFPKKASLSLLESLSWRPTSHYRSPKSFLSFLTRLSLGMAAG